MGRCCRADWCHFPSSQVSFFLFIIFTVYTMLPVGMQEAVGAGLISSLSHLLVLGVYLLLGQDSRAELALQVSHPFRDDGIARCLWPRPFLQMPPSLRPSPPVDLQEPPCWLLFKGSTLCVFLSLRCSLKASGTNEIQLLREESLGWNKMTVFRGNC